MEELADALESGYAVDIIYTDCPHKRLLVKLESIGVQG